MYLRHSPVLKSQYCPLHTPPQSFPLHLPRSPWKTMPLDRRSHTNIDMSPALHGENLYTPSLC